MNKTKHPINRYERLRIAEKNKLDNASKKEARSSTLRRKLTVERTKEKEAEDEFREWDSRT